MNWIEIKSEADLPAGELEILTAALRNYEGHEPFFEYLVGELDSSNGLKMLICYSTAGGDVLHGVTHWCEITDPLDSQDEEAVTRQEYCDYCDGVGWVEGGKALQSDCYRCNGTGLKITPPDIVADRVDEPNPKVEDSPWRDFAVDPPIEGQEIWIVWPSGNFQPEYRKITSEDLKMNWEGMRWMPVPEYRYPLNHEA